MPEPLVTAVIPLHNHADWVMDAVHSVAGQDYPNKRIVVVDDGSTDNPSGAVMERLEGITLGPPDVEPITCLGTIRGTQVMFCRFRQARGPSFARNYGVKAAWEGTDVFFFLDSDDVYEQGKLSRSVAKWQEAPEHIAVVYSDFDTLNPRTGLRVRQYKEPYSRERLVRECQPNCDSLVSKLALKECGLFDESLRTCEDYDLWLRLSERFVLVHLPESLVTIRVGDHSSTATVNREAWEENYRRVMEKARARMTG